MRRLLLPLLAFALTACAPADAHTVVEFSLARSVRLAALETEPGYSRVEGLPDGTRHRAIRPAIEATRTDTHRSVAP